MKNPSLNKGEGNIYEWVNKKMTVRMYTGHPIKEILHAVKAFESAASDISTPEDQKITQFKKCLGVQARDQWDLMESSRAEEMHSLGEQQRNPG